MVTIVLWISQGWLYMSNKDISITRYFEKPISFSLLGSGHPVFFISIEISFFNMVQLGATIWCIFFQNCARRCTNRGIVLWKSRAKSLKYLNHLHSRIKIYIRIMHFINWNDWNQVKKDYLKNFVYTLLTSRHWDMLRLTLHEKKDVPVT